MHEVMIRAVGVALAVAYAAFIGWMYVHQPQSAAEVTGGLAAGVGVIKPTSRCSLGSSAKADCSARPASPSPGGLSSQWPFCTSSSSREC